MENMNGITFAGERFFFFFFLLFFKYVHVFSSSGLNLIKNQIPSNHGSESVSLSVVSKSL